MNPQGVSSHLEDSSGDYCVTVVEARYVTPPTVTEAMNRTVLVEPVFAGIDIETEKAPPAPTVNGVLKAVPMFSVLTVPLAPAGRLEVPVMTTEPPVLRMPDGLAEMLTV
jgi:hypothetical protein